MRKIFTILFILSLSYRWIDVQAQAILWGGASDPNSTFAGGFNGWTTMGLSSDDPAKADSAKWYWSAAASGVGGAYWPIPAPGTPRTAINSASKSNGAMVFNSDLLDNGGVQGDFGLGKCPSKHSGVLISPVIDCSTFNTVALKFNQYYRNYISTTFVDVTNDGITWVPYQLNQDVVTNAETPNNSIAATTVLINISAVAANQGAVQFRFRFDGEYYFWIVDDVQLVKVPDYDLAINSTFYTPASYRQPKSQICQDTFVFQANLTNKGGATQTHCVLRGDILGIDRKTVVFSDSVIIDALDITAIDTPFRTDHYFVPSGLDYGTYYIRWTIYGKDATGADYNPKDNTKLDSFVISLDTYAKAPRETGGVRAGNHAAYTFGNMYRTSDCWNSNDGFYAREVKLQIVANPGGTLDGYGMNVYILRVNDDIDAGFTNFDNTNGTASLSVTIASAEYFVCSSEKNYQDIIVPMFDFYKSDPNDPNIRFPLELLPNSRYFVGVYHTATPTGGVDIFHAVSSEKSYNAQIFSTFVIDDAGAWFNGFQGVNTPICDLNIEHYFIVNTDNKPLPAKTMDLYPNPVVDNTLKVKLNFDVATDANLAVADINGKLLHFESHSGVTNDEFPINTSTLKAGNYLIRVSTEEGTSTKQFTVVR